MFFTDLNFAYLGYNNLPPLQVPDGVWRWDPQNELLLPVITRNEINPNGVRVSPDMRTLYVTDSSATFSKPGPYSPAIGPADTFWVRYPWVELEVRRVLTYAESLGRIYTLLI